MESFIYLCQKLSFLWQKALIPKNTFKSWNQSWLITISLHKHWAISETVRKGSYKIIKDVICLFPELPLRMEILTGIHSLQISHADDPYGQQVARRGFYLERSSKKQVWISLWWEKISNVQTNWVPQRTNTASKTWVNYLTILQNEASAVKNVLTFIYFTVFLLCYSEVPDCSSEQKTLWIPKRNKPLTIYTACEMLAKPFTLKVLSLVYNITAVSLLNRENALVGTMMKLPKCHQCWSEFQSILLVTTHMVPQHWKKMLWRISVVVDTHRINPKYQFLRGVFLLQKHWFTATITFFYLPKKRVIVMWAFINHNYETSQWLQSVSRGFRIQRFRYGLLLEKNKAYYLPLKKSEVKTESAKLAWFLLNLGLNLL